MKSYAKVLIPAVMILSSIPAEAENETVADRMNAGSTITVVHPEALNARLQRQQVEVVDSNDEADLMSTGVQRVRAGYRIQVFDDNNVRTAKHEAENRKAEMETRFPEFKAYLSFNSPYWRVKVGDFKSRSEAEAALAEIKHAFPAMAKSLRIVRDRINP